QCRARQGGHGVLPSPGERFGEMTRDARRSAPVGRRSGRHRAHRARSVPQAIALTVLSALLPGSGFVMAGRAKLGAFVMTLAAGLVGLAVLVGVARAEEVLA